MVRQSGLNGKWKSVGMESKGKNKALKPDLVHKFTNDCNMISTTSGEPSTYKYSLKGNAEYPEVCKAE